MFQASATKQSQIGSLLRDWRWEERLEQLLAGSLWCTLIVAPLAWGGRGDFARMVYAILAAIAGIAWVSLQWTRPRADIRWSPLFALPAFATAWVAFQLVPLPAWMLNAISPRTRELLPPWNSASADALMGQSGWHSVSLNPTATQISLAIFISQALLLFVAFQRLRTVRDLTLLLRWIGISAVVMALFGLLQYFTAGGLFFWVYEHPFRSSSDFVCGSFINRNHFASFLAMGATAIVFQLAQTSNSRSKQPGRATHQPTSQRENRIAVAWACALAIVLVAIVMTASRGALLASVAGAAVLALTYWRKELLAGKQLTYILLTALFVGIGVSVYCEDRLIDRLGDLTSGSVESLDRSGGRRMIWAANLAAISDGWLTGSGAGTHASIYPVYMTESWPKVFSHAENGYLQIATETGLPGIILLLIVFGCVLRWSLKFWTKDASREANACFGAVLAGLAISTVHSVVDFVWFVPATLLLPLLLLIVLRQLAHLPTGRQDKVPGKSNPQTSRGEVTAIVGVAVAYSLVVLAGPAIASPAWSRYLATSAESTITQRQALQVLSAGGDPHVLQRSHQKLEGTIEALQQTLKADPYSADAHIRLARAYIQLFDVRGETRENRMPLGHLQSTVLTGGFETSEEVTFWLERAVGADLQLLHAAKRHATIAAKLSPLEGMAYVYMANLSLFEQIDQQVAEAHLLQADLARPYDGDVLFEIGEQHLISGRLAQAVEYWQRCYRLPGSHRLSVVAALAGRLPAKEFLESFQPDWQTLRAVWQRYLAAGNREDLMLLLAYAEPLATDYVAEAGQTPTPYIWLWLSHMYRDTGDTGRELVCLERAVEEGKTLFAIRQGYALALLRAEQYAQAEPHLRWCVARRPDRGMRNALHAAAKGKLKQAAEVPTSISSKRFQR